MLRSILLLAALAAATVAQAASSPWVSTQGGAVRLVVSGADDSPEIRGMLEIRLEPGWKTYWRDPGDAGIPPTLEAVADSAPADVEILFPAPKRFDDGFSRWAGYDRSVSLPVVFGPRAQNPATIRATAFLGVCEAICIPLEAELAVDLSAWDPRDDLAVRRAFDNLPDPASNSVGVIGVEVSDSLVTVEAAHAEGVAEAELFVAAPPGWSFGSPRAVGKAPGSTRFAFEVLTRPGQAERPLPVAYTLVAGGEAAAGLFEIP